ncbi:MAG TPA: adenylyltransferase/cytidyltransferase family protein [Gaiellaceae bacterium]|nr:adenylyltransferase/cytidyltransferase family protein [Gaiellaceae bacterium]
MGVTVLYGGAFDPPHLGHVAVADAARERFGVARLTILVSERPGHRDVHAPAQDRLDLARAAFPHDDARLDPYPRTIDLLRAERFEDPVLVLGADQLRDFASWKEPEEVLARARLAVAARPGVELPAGAFDRERVVRLDVEPNAAASREIRRRVADGEPLDGLVPAAVAALIAARGLYVRR